MAKPIGPKQLRKKNKLAQQGAGSPSWGLDEGIRLTTWFALLGLGAVGLFSYFLHIEYFPMFDLAAATSLLLSFAYVCLIVLPLLSGLFLFPYLVHAISLRYARQKYAGNPSPGQIGSRALICSCQLALLGFTLGICAQHQWHPSFGLLAYVTLSAAIAWVCYARFTRAVRIDPGSRLARMRPHFLAILPDIGLAGLLQFFSVILLWLFLAQGSPAQQDNWTAYYNNVIWVAVFLGAAGAGLMYSLTQPWGRHTAYVLIPLFLLVPYIVTGLIQGTGAIPMTIARLTKIGNFKADRLVVEGSSCAKLPPELGIACDSGEDPPPIHLCNVHIMSRAGSEIYMRLGLPKTDSEGKHAVIALFLPSDEAQPVQIDTRKKFMHLDNIEKALRTEGSVCKGKLPDMSASLHFDRQQSSLSVAANARLEPIIARVAEDPTTISEISIVGYAADDEEDAGTLVRQRALETWATLARELRTVDRRSVPALVVRAARPNDTPVCDSTFTAAECADAQRRVEVRVVPRSPTSVGNDSASASR